MRIFQLSLPAIFSCHAVQAAWNIAPHPENYPDLAVIPDEGPVPAPSYMVDNTNNFWKVAPDKGIQNGPVWDHSGSLENYMSNLHSNFSHSYPKDAQPFGNSSQKRAVQGVDAGYWLTELGPYGKAPIVSTPSNYSFWRDVTDFGAKGDGNHDDTEAINAAISAGDRCGLKCGNTFSKGAIVYFPPGTYKICTPIIQLYYTQFIGHPSFRPVIKGCSNFTGIALVDTDPYIPGGNGQNWYTNQNQFFRQIRNFVFDLRDMPLSTKDHDQPLVPTGIHWQVAQATSLQNLKFIMPKGTGITHVGIFTENGSGGFVSDMEFEGGNIGWRAGSQQFTAMNLKFTGCNTAVQMIWDWGFNWQRIEVNGGAIAFNVSVTGGIDGQGIGSVSLIDCTFSNVPIGILTSERKNAPPSIVLDNLGVANVGAVVKTIEGNTLLEGGSKVIPLWAAGRRYNGGNGSYQVGPVIGAPKKPAALLQNGKLFTRSRPQYESFGRGRFLVATTDGGLKNDGTGDQTKGINAFLMDAKNLGKIAYFPGGIYSCGGTVTIPTGSVVQGSSWSQLQATGPYFGDMNKPKVFIRVGEKGDVGSMEIVEMLFTVKGPTAGAIMMEWNVHEDRQGSVGMWDSHIRVGGADGSDLGYANCPRGGFSDKCICMSLLLHVTSKATGYFENVWTWIADHDNDKVSYRVLDPQTLMISLYGARGMLIESQGPCWFYGTGSEHAVLYQYQLYKAKNIYLGHLQTEAPYFQPVPVAPAPFNSSIGTFPGDPTFSDCKTDSCRVAWGVRIVDSSDVHIHSAGLYSWFNNYEKKQACVKNENCQEKILQVKGSQNVAVYNLFTKAVLEIASGGKGNSISRNDSQSGYTTEVSVWFPLDQDGSDAEVVYVGTEIYGPTHTFGATAPFIAVFPPSSIPTTGITVGNYTTSFEVGHTTRVVSQGTTQTVFIVTTTTVVITIGIISTDTLSMSNINVTNGQGSGIITLSPYIPLGTFQVPLTNADGAVTTRTVNVPDWPSILKGPPEGWTPVSSASWGQITGAPTSRISTGKTPISEFTGQELSSIWNFDGDVRKKSPIIHVCPPNSLYIDAWEVDIVLPDCYGTTTLDWYCLPTRTISLDAPTSVSFSLGCALWTGTSTKLDYPTLTEWPKATLIPVAGDVSDDDTKSKKKSKCRAWFFFICIGWIDLEIKGWDWGEFPIGVILPPGPPPTIKWPPGITIKGDLPGPWPRITIGIDGGITYPQDQPTECKTQTASACRTTTTLEMSVNGGSTKTTATKTIETCATILGCNVKDDGTQATTTDACTVSTVTILNRDVPTPIASVVARQAGKKKCPTVKVEDAVIYPVNPKDTGKLISWLKKTPSTGTKYWDRTGTKQVVANKLGGSGFTAFFYVEKMSSTDVEILMKEGGEWFGKTVDFAYQFQTWKRRHMDGSDSASGSSKRSNNDFNMTGTIDPRSGVQKRDAKPTSQDPADWELSQISTPQGTSYDWARSPGIYNYDSSAGSGQVVYAIEDAFWDKHPEFDGKIAAGLLESNTRGRQLNINKNAQLGTSHGNTVLSKVGGARLGIAKKAKMVIMLNTALSYVEDNGKVDIYSKCTENVLASLLFALDHIKGNNEGGVNNEGKSVINFSASVDGDTVPPAFLKMMLKIFKALDEMNVVIVASAHNEYSKIDYSDFVNGKPTRAKKVPDKKDSVDGTYPAVWANPRGGNYQLPNLILVGSTDINTRIAQYTPYQPWMVFAPGAWCNAANQITGFGKGDGNSFATPLVAGLVAYYRGLPSRWATDFQSPRNVKAFVMAMQRKLDFDVQIEPGEKDPSYRDRVAFIWNGMVGKKNCLLESKWATTSGSSGFGVGYEKDENLCPKFNTDLSKLPTEPQGGSEGSCIKGRQLNGQACDSGLTVTYTPGPASPTCLANGCGTLCTGFWCQANPTGYPPDFQDPADPSYGNSLTRTATKNPNPATTNNSAAPTPTCDDACKMDRGYPCTELQAGFDRNSPNCCGSGTCGTCATRNNAPLCCATHSCGWAGEVFNDHPVSSTCQLSGFLATNVNCALPFFIACDSGNGRGFYFEVDGKKGGWTCKNCNPIGTTGFSNTDIGMHEQVTLSWDGKTDCHCTVDGEKVAGTVTEHYSEDFFGFHSDDTVICACKFHCTKWGVFKAPGKS